MCTSKFSWIQTHCTVQTHTCPSRSDLFPIKNMTFKQNVKRIQCSSQSLVKDKQRFYIIEAYSVGVGEVSGISEPATEVVVGAPSCDVIHHQSSGRSPVVAPSHRPGRCVCVCVCVCWWVGACIRGACMYWRKSRLVYIIPKSLLACGVPDLQFDFLTWHFHYSRPKLHPNCVWTVGHDCNSV